MAHDPDTLMGLPIRYVDDLGFTPEQRAEQARLLNQMIQNPSTIRVELGYMPMRRKERADE